MPTRPYFLSLIAIALSATFAGGLACDSEGGEQDELPTVDCNSVEVPSFAEMTVWNNCVGCHSSQLSGAARQDAPSEFNYDSHEAAMFDPFETAEVVLEGEMPPTGELSQADKDLINIWAQCGTP
ncbi:MAG: hypothetical protein R3A51_15955 [Nannocystaceae bacterium]|nr:hypothetical protein [Myxococcales bacterium]